MACRLFGTKPLSELMLAYCQLGLWEQIQWNFNQNSNIFIKENEFENVIRKIATIFSRPQYVKFPVNPLKLTMSHMPFSFLSDDTFYFVKYKILVLQQNCATSVAKLHTTNFSL